MARGAERAEIIEGLLDSGTERTVVDDPRSGVARLLWEISQVCHAKAEHIRDNYGERDPDAKVWETIANLVDKSADRVGELR